MLLVKPSKKVSVDLSTYDSDFGIRNKVLRVIWNSCYWVFFRPFNLSIFQGWRNFVLRLFGAKIGFKAHVYATVKIWAPWNLEIGDFSSLARGVDCYNQGKITIGKQTIISQKTYLCASSHDYTRANFPLILAPIVIKDQVWIAAGAFIAPGVSIGEGAVVGAKSAVFKDVDEWTVVGGNPAKFIKNRLLNEK